MFQFLASTYRYSLLLWNIRKIYEQYKSKDKLDDNDLNTITLQMIPYIEKCGCVCIKFCQWLTPILDILLNVKQESHNQLTNDRKPYWLASLEKFYENCSDHSLEYTCQVYKQDFNSSLIKDYQVVSIIGSGSIGQVYKLKSLKDNQYYAMKVVHPSVSYDMKYFKRILTICFKINYLKTIFRKVLPYNIDSFLDLFEKQIDLIWEANNLCRLRQNYKTNDYIQFPELIRFSENIVLMTYEEGVSIDSESVSQYERAKLVNLLVLFNRQNFEINTFCHGDLHKGNWKVQPYKDRYRLVIYDFGFCWSYVNPYINQNLSDAFIDSSPADVTPLVKLTVELINQDKSEEFHEYIRDTLLGIIKKDNLVADPSVCILGVLKACNEKNLIVEPVILQTILVFIQIFKYLDMYGLTNTYEKHPTNEFIYRNIYPNIISICQSYNIFPDIVHQFQKKLNHYQPEVSELFDTLDSTKHITPEIRNLLKFD